MKKRQEARNYQTKPGAAPTPPVSFSKEARAVIFHPCQHEENSQEALRRLLDRSGEAKPTCTKCDKTYTHVTYKL